MRGSGFQTSGLRFNVQGLGFRVEDPALLAELTYKVKNVQDGVSSRRVRGDLEFRVRDDWLKV